MSIDSYFLVAAATLLFVSFLFMKGSQRYQLDSDADEVQAEAEPTFKRDSLTAQLSARIFSSEDLEFVFSESCRSVARAFRHERTRLAIEWLRGIRRQVNSVFQSHRKAARRNPDLRPAGELRLGIYFLTFQLATGMLYVAIRFRGPIGAARLVLLYLELSDKLRKMAEDVLPSPGIRVSAELLELEQHANNRRGDR